MTLKPVTDFSAVTTSKGSQALHTALQDKAKIAKNLGSVTVRGMCFRLSYKWLATTWNGETWKALGTNMEKTFDKQMAYLAQADTLSSSGYDQWFQGANTLSKETLIAWGSKHNLTCSTPIDLGKTLASTLIDGDEEAAIIVGFFGKKASSASWGHATAYCHRKPKPLFFDINYGVFEFEGAGSRAADLHGFVKGEYCSNPIDPKDVENFVLYRLDK